MVPNCSRLGLGPAGAAVLAMPDLVTYILQCIDAEVFRKPE